MGQGSKDSRCIAGAVRVSLVGLVATHPTGTMGGAQPLWLQRQKALGCREPGDCESFPKSKEEQKVLEQTGARNCLWGLREDLQNGAESGGFGWISFTSKATLIPGCFGLYLKTHEASRFLEEASGRPGDREV